MRRMKTDNLLGYFTNINVEPQTIFIIDNVIEFDEIKIEFYDPLLNYNLDFEPVNMNISNFMLNYTDEFLVSDGHKSYGKLGSELLGIEVYQETGKKDLIIEFIGEEGSYNCILIVRGVK